METDPEEHRLNYERYRTLLMVEYSGGEQWSTSNKGLAAIHVLYKSFSMRVIAAITWLRV